MKKEYKYLLQIHAAVFLFGMAGLFGKLLNLPATIITLGRVAFATIALLIILIHKNKSIKLNSNYDYIFLGLLGVILAVHWAAFFHSIQISTVAIGLLTFSTFPIFATFIEPLFFKERLTSGNILIALVAFVGISLVIPSWDISNNAVQGALWGTVSGFTFALLQTLNRKYVKKYSSMVITFYQVGIATVVLLPFIFIDPVPFDTGTIFLLALLGFVFTGLAHSLFINGLKVIKVQTASIIASLESVYGILFAVLLLKEIPSLRTIIGGLIILGAAFYVSMHSQDEKIAININNRSAKNR